MGETFTKFKKSAQKFSTDNNFIFLAVGLAFVFHIFALDLVGIALFALSAAALFFFTDETRPPFVLMATSVFIVSTKKSPGYFYEGQNYYTQVYVLIIIGICAAALLASLIYRIIRTPSRFKNMKLLVPFSVLGVVFLISGVGKEYYLQSLLFGAFQVAMYLGFYVVVCGLLSDMKNSLEFVATFFSALSLLVSMEVVAFYVQTAADGVINFGIEGLASVFADEGFKDSMIIGWGVSNLVGEMLLLFNIFVPFRMEKSRNHGWYTLLWLFNITVFFFTLNRAGMLFGLPINVFLFVFAMVRRYKNGGRIKIRDSVIVIVAYVVFVAIMFIAFVGFMGKTDAIQHLIDYFTGSILSPFINGQIHFSKRDKLWNLAFEYFKKFPVFGAGFARTYLSPTDGFSSIYGEEFNIIFRALFHSFFFQTLGSSGVVGLIGLGYFIFGAGKTLFRKHDGRIYNVCFAVAFALISLLDIIYFIPYCSFFLIVVICLAEKEGAAEKGGAEVKAEEAKRLRAE